MMYRNGKPAAIHWLLLDAKHPDYDAAIGLLRLVHEGRPNVALSVNTRNDEKQALAKLLGPMPALPAGIVIRTYTEADHSEALALVNTRATEQDPSAGWKPPVAPK